MLLFCYNDYSFDDLIDITPKSTTLSAYEEIEINYHFLYEDFPGTTWIYNVILVSKEIFTYKIDTIKDILTLVFYKSGEKRIWMYFSYLTQTTATCIEKSHININ